MIWPPDARPKCFPVGYQHIRVNYAEGESGAGAGEEGLFLAAPTASSCQKNPPFTRCSGFWICLMLLRGCHYSQCQGVHNSIALTLFRRTGHSALSNDPSVPSAVGSLCRSLPAKRGPVQHLEPTKAPGGDHKGPGRPSRRKSVIRFRGLDGADGAPSANSHTTCASL